MRRKANDRLARAELFVGLSVYEAWYRRHQQAWALAEELDVSRSPVARRWSDPKHLRSVARAMREVAAELVDSAREIEAEIRGAKAAAS